MSTDQAGTPGERGADVVVVGFGNAAIAAALSAHDLGAEVVILEKMPEQRAGGNSRVSGQVWFSPHDSDGAKGYLAELTEDMTIDDDVVETWARECALNSEWVRALAVEVQGSVARDPDDAYGQGADVTTITHGDEMLRMTGWVTDAHEYPEFDNSCGTEYHYIGPSQGYSRLWQTLRAAVVQRGIAVEYDTCALELTRDGAGRVDGVLAEGPGGRVRYAARRGVVLAAGGFENDQRMIRTYLGLPYATPWGSPGNTGDGIKMAQHVGADLQNMYNYMPFMGIRIPEHGVGEFVQPGGPGFMYVRRDGRRFVDETTSYRHGKIRSGGSLALFPHQPMWTIFDEDVRLAAPLAMTRERFAGGWLKQVERYDWSPDNSAEIERGWIARGETLRDLAAELGIDPDGLEQEVERFNAACAAGEDGIFGRPGETMAPILRGPFYGYRWGNMMITTLGGLRKDGRARVLDTRGEPIPGLHCAGEICSTYAWGLSGGQSIGDALAFGRVAGREAAAG